jgi:hypothetical protein
MLIASFWLGVVVVWTYHLFFLRLVQVRVDRLSLFHYRQVGFVYFLFVSFWMSWMYGGIDRMVLHRWQLHKAANEVRQV